MKSKIFETVHVFGKISIFPQFSGTTRHNSVSVSNRSQGPFETFVNRQLICVPYSYVNYQSPQESFDYEIWRGKNMKEPLHFSQGNFELLFHLVSWAKSSWRMIIYRMLPSLFGSRWLVLISYKHWIFFSKLNVTDVRHWNELDSSGEQSNSSETFCVPNLNAKIC